MYGTVNQHATGVILKKARAMNTAVTINAVNIINATSGNSAPKKAKDHNALNIILIANKI